MVDSLSELTLVVFVSFSVFRRFFLVKSFTDRGHVGDSLHSQISLARMRVQTWRREEGCGKSGNCVGTGAYLFRDIKGGTMVEMDTGIPCQIDYVCKNLHFLGIIGS